LSLHLNTASGVFRKAVDGKPHKFKIRHSMKVKSASHSGRFAARIVPWYILERGINTAKNINGD
jgi:hypothetical protein